MMANSEEFLGQRRSVRVNAGRTHSRFGFPRPWGSESNEDFGDDSAVAHARLMGHSSTLRICRQLMIDDLIETIIRWIPFLKLDSSNLSHVVPELMTIVERVDPSDAMNIIHQVFAIIPQLYFESYNASNLPDSTPGADKTAEHEAVITNVSDGGENVLSSDVSGECTNVKSRTISETNCEKKGQFNSSGTSVTQESTSIFDTAFYDISTSFEDISDSILEDSNAARFITASNDATKYIPCNDFSGITNEFSNCQSVENRTFECFAERKDEHIATTSKLSGTDACSTTNKSILVSGLSFAETELDFALNKFKAGQGLDDYNKIQFATHDKIQTNAHMVTTYTKSQVNELLDCCSDFLLDYDMMKVRALGAEINASKAPSAFFCDGGGNRMLSKLLDKVVKVLSREMRDGLVISNPNGHNGGERFIFLMCRQVYDPGRSLMLSS